MSGRRSASVIAAAAVLVGLLLVGIATIVSSGGGDYSQHTMALYGTRATLYAQAALRETALGMQRKLGTPEGRDAVAGQSWAVFEKQARETVKALPAGNASGPLLERTVADLAPQTALMASEGGARLTSMTLAFRGFEPIENSPAGIDLSDPVKFYRDPFHILDPATPPAPEPALTGFAVLSATVAFEGPRIYLERKLEACHVLKISAPSTIARDFVFFDWGDTRGAPPERNMKSDLDEGGSLLLFGRRDGRIFLRGPYEFSSHGYRGPYCYENPTDSTAGGLGPDPRKAPGFMPAGVINADTYEADHSWVNCWATMPAPRAGVLELCGPLFIRSFMEPHPQVRPRRWTAIGLPSCPAPTGGGIPVNLGQVIGGVIGGLASAFVCVVDMLLPISWLDSCWMGDLFDDIGMKLQTGQWWWIETDSYTPEQVKGEAPTDYFSIAGATIPDSKGRVRVSPFRGVLLTQTTTGGASGDVREFRQSPDEWDAFAKPEAVGLPPVGRYYVPVEGVADTLFHRATHCGSPACANAYSVNIDRTGEDPQKACSLPGFMPDKTGYQTYPSPLALYWAPAEFADASQAFLSDLLSFTLTVVGGALGARVSSVGSLLTRVLAGAVAGQLADSAVHAMVAAWEKTSTGTYGVGGGPAAGDFEFPPGYGLPDRTAIRRYRTLADYPGLYTYERRPDLVPNAEFDLLVLDGPIWIEDLKHDRPLLYRGRGALLTADRDDPYLTAPIVSAQLYAQEFQESSEMLGVLGQKDAFLGRTEATDKSDDLTLFVRGNEAEPWTSAGGLTFRVVAGAAGKTFGLEDPAPIDAHVVSLQGVRPEKAGQAIRIVGNLVAYHANRSHVPAGSKIEVMYRPPAPTAPSFVTMSPAWSAYHGESE